MLPEIPKLSKLDLSIISDQSRSPTQMHIASDDTLIYEEQNQDPKGDDFGLDGPEKETPTTHAVENAVYGGEPPTSEAVYSSHHIIRTRFRLLFAGMLFSIILVALDQALVAAALPAIVSKFGAQDKVTWLTAAFFMTQAGFMVLYGKLLTVASQKWVYLGALMILEIGNVICGASSSMALLIFGRSVAGVGAAGIVVSALSIISRMTHAQELPLLFGWIGVAFGATSVVGLLIGGAFLEHVSWRLCFYINLPLGAIAIICVLVFADAASCAPLNVDLSTSFASRLWRMDTTGAVLCMAMTSCLVLALQFGKEWDQKVIIGVFVVFAVLFAVFIGYEYYLDDSGVLPLSIFKNRTLVGASLECFFLTLSIIITTTYLPLFYQASKQHRFTQLAMDMLPYLVSSLIGVGISAMVINVSGRPLPFLVGPPILFAIGSGLIFWNLTTSPNPQHLLRFQVLCGLGGGCALQNAIMTVQIEHKDRPAMIPQSITIVVLCQLLGVIVGLGIASGILSSRLRIGLGLHAPGLDAGLAEAIQQNVSFIFTLPEEQKEGAIKAYSEALGHVFILGIPGGILASFSGMMIRNYNIKRVNVEPVTGV